MGVENIVVHDRQQLAQDGMVIPIVVLSSTSGEVTAGPDMVSRGFVYMDESEDLMNEAKEIVIHAINHPEPGGQERSRNGAGRDSDCFAAVFQKENRSTPDGPSCRYAGLINPYRSKITCAIH